MPQPQLTVHDTPKPAGLLDLPPCVKTSSRVCPCTPLPRSRRGSTSSSISFRTRAAGMCARLLQNCASH